MSYGELLIDQLARRTGVRCGDEIACSPQFLGGGLESSPSAQIMAPKIRVLEAMREIAGD